MDQRETGKGLSWAPQCQRGGSRLPGKLLPPCPEATAGMRRLQRHVPEVVYKQKKLLKELDISVDVLQGWGQRCSDWWDSGRWTPTTKEAGYGEQGSSSSAFPREAWPQRSAVQGAVRCGAVTPGAPATRTSGDRGRDVLSRGQGGSRAVAPCPRSPAAVTRCPAPAHPGLGPPRPSTY